MRERLHLLIIPACALLAVLPLIVIGSSCGHDYGFHVLNWLEVSTQWNQGLLLPHWEFTAAFNSGEPRFVFYPPLSWVIGALLGFIVRWIAAPATFIWLALTACGFTMYRLAREWTSEANALIAAGFYMVHPYMLFTAFERAAYAELLAAAWVPLVMLAILRPNISAWKLALAVALLWITNNPGAVMGCYSLALLAVIRVAWIWIFQKQPRPALKDAGTMAAGTCLGLALAGFYLVPATLERAWVDISMVRAPGTRYQDNFLFGRSVSISHTAILRTASLCMVALLACIAVFAAIAFLRKNKQPAAAPAENWIGYRRFAILALVLLSLFVGFLLTATSTPLWRLIPELKYLQFPWRFGTILGAAAAALLALALGRIRLRLYVAIPCAMAIPLLLGAVGNHFFRQYCSASNDVEGMVAAFRVGETHDPTDEYTPSTADSLAIGHDNPATWLANTPTAPPPDAAAGPQFVNLHDRLHFVVASPTPAFYVINLRDYPAWHVTLNGKASRHRPHREDGLIVVPIPGGQSQIDISWTTTPDHIWGWLVSALALIAFLFVWRRDRLRSSTVSRDRITSPAR